MKVVAPVCEGELPAPSLPKRSRRIANQPLANIASSKRAEVLLMQRFDGVPAQEGSSEPAKKMIADYFDGNLSGKYMEAARKLFLSLRKNGTWLRADRRWLSSSSLLLLTLPLLCCFIFSVNHNRVL
jgi:hypothetical protein